MQPSMGGNDVIGLGIDRTIIPFGRGKLEVNHFRGARPSAGHPMQVHPLDGTDGKGATDTVRRAGNCLGYGRPEAQSSSPSWRLHTSNGTWVDGPMDGGNGPFLFSSADFLWVSGFNWKP